MKVMHNSVNGHAQILDILYLTFQDPRGIEKKLSDLFLSLLLEQFTAEHQWVPCFLLIFRPMCVIQNNTKVKHTIATNFYLYLLHICTLPMQ